MQTFYKIGFKNIKTRQFSVFIHCFLPPANEVVSSCHSLCPRSRVLCDVTHDTWASPYRDLPLPPEHIQICLTGTSLYINIVSYWNAFLFKVFILIFFTDFRCLSGTKRPHRICIPYTILTNNLTLCQWKLLRQPWR